MSESTSFDRGANVKPGDFPPVPESKDELLIEALRLAERTSGLLNELDRELGALVGDDSRFEGLNSLLRRRFQDCSGVHLFIAAHNIGLDLPPDLLSDEEEYSDE